MYICMYVTVFGGDGPLTITIYHVAW